jgi:secondary-alcohol dehydrogenase (coenzyme-F420)
LVKLTVAADASFWISPDLDLDLACSAEDVGFDVLWLGDHFLPWHDSFKSTFFGWNVMMAIAGRTKKVKIGVDVTVPIGARYHPAIVAQSFATMDALYPGRIMLGVGAGESMNEERFLGRWPSWKERIERLTEGLDLIRKLWTEEDFFDFEGKYFKMNKIFLYVKPKSKIPIYFSALGPKSARMAGIHGDHLMTAVTPEKCREEIIPSFKEGAKEAGKNPDRMDRAAIVPGAIGDVDAALNKVRRLLAGTIVPENYNEPDPRKIERSARTLSPEVIKSNYYLCRSADEMIELFERFERAGITHVIYSDFSPNAKETMESFRSTIIPYFRK